MIESLDPPHILNTLKPAQEQINLILGHSLASLYQDVLEAPLPPHLEALTEKLSRAFSPNMKSSSKADTNKTGVDGKDRYYFDVCLDGTMWCTDPDGDDLATSEDARQTAFRIAGELTKDGISTYRRISVRVRDRLSKPSLTVEISVAETVPG